MILAIRPEPGAGATVAAAAALGLGVESCPLSLIRPLEWAMPSGDFDGLLLGSANALRHGGSLVDNLVDKPVYAVGAATAVEARERGFAVARCGDRGLQALLDGLTGQELRLLRIAGREHVPVNAPEGIVIETAIAYESMLLPLPAEVARRLGQGAVALLHSAAAARHFAAECDRLAVQRRAIRLAALSPRIAEAAGEGWGAVQFATEPAEGALLALARDMCHEPPLR
jgi:uroporphyrinogen-III synthase